MKTAMTINQALTSLNLVDLPNLTVRDMRELLSSLGITGVSRPSTNAVVPVKLGRRCELLAALEGVKNREKPPSTPSLKNIPVSYTSCLDRLRAIAETEGDDSTMTREVAILSGEVNAYITSIYTGSHFTRNDKRSDFRANVKRLAERDSILVRSLANMFCADLSRLGVDDVTLKREGDKTRAKVKAEEGVWSPSAKFIAKLIARAESTLTAFNQSPSPLMWKDVAIALGIATGRRMYSEILCTSSQFSLVPGGSEVRFTGLAKGHEENPNAEYIDLPTLVDSRLVVDAFINLEKMGKRFDHTSVDRAGVYSEFEQLKIARDKAQKRYSKDLAKYWKELMQSEVENEGEKLLDTTPKSMRSWYIDEVTKDLTGMAKNMAKGRLLGHRDEGIVIADSYGN